VVDYVDLLKASLTGTLHQDVYVARPAYTGPRTRLDRWLSELACAALRRRDWEIVRRMPVEAVQFGQLRPLSAETMAGTARLDNLQWCIENVVSEGIPGDLIETGVWRGGASIFMRGMLRALEVADRRVWVADSFRGLPPPSARFPADAGDEHHRVPELAVSVEAVRENFRRYGLLDESELLLRSYGGNSQLAKFKPATQRELVDSLPALAKALLRRKVTPAAVLKPHKLKKADLDAVKRLYDRLDGKGERNEFNIYISGRDEDNA